MSMNSITALSLSALSSAQTSTNLGIALDGSVPFSVDAWFRLDGLCAMASLLVQEGAFQFGIVGRSVVLAINGFPTVQSHASAQPLTTGVWHYACATYDGGSVRLYIDGAFNTMQSITGTGAAGNSPFLLGYEMQGSLSCVRVYNTSLTAEVVQANMYGTPGSASVVCWFDFTQVPPVDQGSGLSITLQYGAVSITSTPALDLHVAAYAEPLGDGDVNPGGHQADAYTVQAWIWVESSRPETQVILANSDLDTDAGMALLLARDATTGELQAVSSRGSNVDENELTGTSAIPVKTWTNIATTYDGTTLSLYVNSELSASAPFAPIALYLPASDLLIGGARVQGTHGAGNVLQGYISIVEMWNCALSAAEIAQYAAQAPGPETQGLVALYDFTTSPARNQVNSHPVGLAAGAFLGAQVSAATSGAAAAPAPDIRPPRPAFDQDEVDAIRRSLDYSEFLDSSGELLVQARERDVQAFAGDPEAQALISFAWEDAVNRMRAEPQNLFHVTRHKAGDRTVLVAHSRGGSYVCYQGADDDFDDCTMWKVELVFILIGGALDAFFSIRAKLSGNATKYIVNRILTAPALKTMLSTGAGITGTLVFAFLYNLYSSGVLRDLVWLIIDLGFWALLRIIAGMILKVLIPSAGLFQVIASLAATAAMFITKYTGRPKSCLPLPAVTLAAIQFDYDPTASSVEALTIRQNYTTAVAVPEWTPSCIAASDSLAAYSIASVSGHTPTIQARFTINTNDPITVQIKADDGGILGAIDPVSVSFVNGQSSPVFVTLQLSHHQVGTAGIQVQDIAWTWSYQVPSGTWTQIAATKHRIYAILNSPTMPWVQVPDRSGTQLPWTDILDYSCVWAAGKTTVTDAATAVTEKVNSGLGLSYDTTHGASNYTNWGSNPMSFLASDFVLLLKGLPSKGLIVNCTDCATIVSTFADILGCDLTESTMYPATGGGFLCNEIIAIGGPGWAYPFPPGNMFSYHEVAWLSPYGYSQSLFDACLQVDTSSDPWNWAVGTTHVPGLPTNMVFTTLGMSPALPIATPFTDQCYQERLAQNSVGGINACSPQGPFSNTQNGRRPVI